MKKFIVVLLIVGFVVGCSNPFWPELLPDKGKEDDSIVFNNSSSEITKTYGDPAFTNAIAPGYKGTGVITYYSSDEDIAWVDENTGEVFIHKTGEVVITAVKAADKTYVQAQAQYTLKVNKATLTVMADNFNINYNDAIPQYTYSITGFVNDDTKETAVTGTPVLSCSYNPGNPVNSYPINILIGSLAADNYSFSFVNGTLSVGLSGQSPLLITDPGEKIYGDTAFNLNTTGGSGEGIISYVLLDGADIINLSENTITIKRAGVANVKAVKAGDSNYQSIESDPITITVEKRNLSNAIVNVGGEYIYTGGAHTPSPIVTDNDLVTASDYTVSYDNNIGAGTATVTITAMAEGNYLGTQNGNFIIDKAILTVIADDKSISFNDEAPEFTYEITGFVSGEDETVVSGMPVLNSIYTKGDPINSYPITITQGNLTAANYDFAFEDGQLSVGLAVQIALSINDPGEKIYGNEPFTLSTTGGSGLGNVSYKVINGADIIDVNESTGEIIINKAGTAKIIARKAGDDGYSSVTSAPITITVGKRELSESTVSVKTRLRYMGSEHTPTPSVADSGIISLSDYTVTDYTDNINAGTATVTITATDNGNYFGMQSGTFNIRKAALTVTADDKVIDFNAPSPDYTYNITGFVDGEDVLVVSGEAQVTSLYTPGNAIGQYTITVEQGSLAADNYYFKLVNGTLYVGMTDQPPLSINDPGVKTYGDAEFTLSTTGGSGDGTVSYEVISGGDVISVTTGGTVTILKVGTATVTATKAGDGNYNPVSSEAITITVSKAVPDYTLPTGLTSVYGNLLSSVVLPAGWAWNNGTVTVGDAGSRSFAATFTPNDTDNYNIVNENITVSVGKAAGAAVSTPTADGIPVNGNITVNAVSIPVNPGNQTAEYAVSTESGLTGAALDALQWQNGTAFSVMNTAAAYYIYARSAENVNYNAGAATVSAAIHIYAEQGFQFQFVPPVDNTPTVSGITISRTGIGHLVKAKMTVTNSGDYDSVEWRYGAVVLGTEWELELDAADIRYNVAGTHNITIVVRKNGIPYSKTISFVVVNE